MEAFGSLVEDFERASVVGGLVYFFESDSMKSVAVSCSSISLFVRARDDTLIRVGFCFKSVESLVEVDSPPQKR